MKRLLLLFALAACDPALPPPTPTPTPSPSPTRSPTPTPTPANVDARVDFEEGLDPDFGVNTTSVRAFLDVPALGLRKKLFTVPFPYSCSRGASDAGDDLVVQCTGPDGFASASVRAEAATIVVLARDYGAIALHRTRDEIPLPAGSTATVFAPARYPNATR